MKPLKPHTIDVVFYLGNEQLDAVRRMSEQKLRILMGQISEVHPLWRECVKRLRRLKHFQDNSREAWSEYAGEDSRRPRWRTEN